MRLGLENIQMGSLSGAEHLLHQNVDVRRLAQCEQKSHVEYKGKSKSKQSNLRVDCVRKHVPLKNTKGLTPFLYN